MTMLGIRKEGREAAKEEEVVQVGRLGWAAGAKVER